MSVSPSPPHVLPGAGHVVQMEAAEQANRPVVDFLRGLP
jgi:pimeloyl-ACP methyl ester carboxylesterase